MNLVVSINTWVTSQFGESGVRAWLTGSESPTRLQSRCQWVPRCHLETDRGKICFQAHVHGCWQEPIPRGLLDQGPQWCCSQFLAMWDIGQLTTWQLTSSKPARERVGEQDGSYNLTLRNHGSDRHHPCHIPLVRSKS